MNLPANYERAAAEAKWQKFWDDNKIYKFDPSSKAEPFTIDTPPPTVSGKLHIGHVFSYTQTEIIARYQRQAGKNVLYPFGFDDNGLPTEILTEKETGKKGADMPREDFVKLCEETSAKYRVQFRDLWMSLGFSCAWDNVYSTISKSSQRISQRSFLDLLKKDKVDYRSMPTLWCVKCQTSFAQAEVDDVPKGTTFNYLNFSAADGTLIPIATTRPELLPACVAMFIHPENEKYKHLIGQQAIVPLFGHTVTILADEKADPDKGTGIVMCCTFGDVTDIEWFRKHKLPNRLAFTRDGKMNELAGEFAGLTINEARKQITAKLVEAQLIYKQEEISAEKRVVNTHERCGTPVEYLDTKQWFIKVVDAKEDLIKQGEKVNWFPAYMGKRYRDWVDNLGWDWAISRQRYYGVPIPVWYAPDGTVIPASDSQLPVNPLVDKPLDCKGYDPATLIPEKDVLDTWATSSISPELNWRWGEKDEMPQLRPMSMRPQAHDIIRTWAFYTIVKSWFHHGDIPWKDAVISGHVIKKEVKVETQKVEGQAFERKSKISKSKDGDKFSPLRLIEEFGADAIRYWATSGTLGSDIAFDEDEIDGASKLLTKLWNSSKFAAGFLEGFDPKASRPQLEPVDQWILGKFDAVIKNYHNNFGKHEFFPARNGLEQFFWGDYCDNYIELVKDRLYSTDPADAERARAAKWTLYTLTLGQLKLFAPFLPHITEEIYQGLFAELEGDKSIHISSYPVVDSALLSADAAKAGELLLEVVGLVRGYKSRNNYSMKLAIDTISIAADAANTAALKLVEKDILGVCKAGKVSFVAEIANSEDKTERLALHIEMDKAALLRNELVSELKPLINEAKKAFNLKAKDACKVLYIQAPADLLKVLETEPGQLEAAARSEKVVFNAAGKSYLPLASRPGMGVAVEV